MTAATASETIGTWARVETAACARRLAAMVVLLDRCRAAGGSEEREQWYLDNWGAVCARIGAEQQITPAAAGRQLMVATSLRDRLPLVAARFAEGYGSYQLMSTIVWRTGLVNDPAALRTLDAAVAGALAGWEPMSEKKTIAAIDAWVAKVDPQALRRVQTAARGRGLHIDFGGGDGMASLWGTLLATDATALDERLKALGATVCGADPRTVAQRHVDALGALAVGSDRLRCRCGTSTCPVADADAGSAKSTVVYVIVNQDTVDDTGPAALAQDAALDGAPPEPPPGDRTAPAEAHVGAVTPEFSATRPGRLFSGPLLPGPVMRRVLLEAAVRRVFHPGAAPPERRYTPSRSLADFVRCRDLTCRFPGCDVPATDCDVDHTIPYPAGPTQASNLKCLCRFHHLLKTFWGMPGGWSERQDTDGTVRWTAPDGRIHTTRPGSRVLFPSLCRPTAPVMVTVGRSAVRSGLRMPRRDRTRVDERRRRNDLERQLNAERGNRDVLAM